MSSSRVRTRLVAITAAIPVLVAGGPFASPATASSPYAVANLLAAGQAVGPNTGYLGRGVGQAGSTAMFKVTPPTNAATISAVEVTLTQLDNPNTFIYQNELDSADGLALYADVNDNGEFDANDKATGLRSNGFRSGRVQANGDIPFLISLAAPTSGANAYFIAIHPATTAVNGRRMAFRVDIGDIGGSGGTGPFAAVSTPLQDDDADPRMVIDSVGPVAPGRDAFTPTSKIPGEEDLYTIAAGAVADTTAMLAFYNSESSIAQTALLTRPGFDPAQPVMSQLDKVAYQPAVPGSPTSPTVAPIGDGSGIQTGVTTVAKNNQLSNAVYARLIDSIGNVSAPVVLSDCFILPPATSPCETARGNPVIGPDKPSTAALPSGVTAINIANEAAVPLDVTTASTSTAARTTRATVSATNADTSSQAVKVEAHIVQVTATGVIEPDYGTAKKQKNYTVGGTAISWTSSDGFDTTLKSAAPKGIKEGEAVAVAVAVNIDRAGNPSVLTQSATKYTKDITAPTLTISADKPTLTTNDLVSLQFSEVMTKSNITERKPDANTGVCADDTGARSVEQVLNVVDDQAGNADRTWGRNNCFEWLGNGSAAKIKIGDVRPQECSITVGDDCTPFPAIGDMVRYAGAGGSSLADLAGNLIVGLGTAPFHTTLVNPPPIPLDAATRDVNVNGVLDGVMVDFSSEMSLSSIEASLSKFSAVGPTTVPVTAVSFPVNTDESKVLFTFVSEFGTGELPQIRLTPATGETGTGVVDKANRAVPPFSITPRDEAKPQPLRASTLDDNRDGRLDKITLHYSESIQHAKDNNPPQSNVSGPAYHVAGYAPAAQPPGTEGRNTVAPTTGNGSTKSVTLTRPNTNFDTNLSLSVKFTRFQEPVTGTMFTPTDLAGNAWDQSSPTSFTLPAPDGAAPFYVSRLTRDLDADGKVDAIDVKFTENIPTASTGASFTVTGHQIVDQFAIATDTIRIVIDETAPASGDTAPTMTPTMQYHSGITDVSGNAMTADPAPVTTTDGAGPAIVAACPGSPKGSNGTCPEDDPAITTDDGTKMHVFFSEPLTTSTAIAADFVVEQPAGATPAKTVSNVTVTNAADGKSATALLSFAQGTLSSTEDSVVRLSGDGVVADSSSVVSTQKSNVVATAPPTVSLAITCPIATPNPAYCGSTTINTGAAGSTAVTKWRLKQTARGTVIDPNDYTSARPDSMNLVEGSYTLYLSGLDEFGRLSPEVSAPITILTPPRIDDVQFVHANPTSRGEKTFSKDDTVVDGDTLHIGADAYGTDADEWAANGAPLGGGCLAAHMSIDLRAITNNSSDGNRAPTSCDLSPPDAEQEFREMEFPVVKATGTTRYPVGTVLKATDSDPGSIVVDGANGTLARRQFISVGARRSWMISDASVIKVPSHLISSIPRNSKNVGYRDGAVLRSSSGYYYVENGVKRPVSSYRLRAWRISTTTAYRPTSAELRAMPTGRALGGSSHQAGTWIKYSSGKIYQVVRNAQGKLVRRPLAHSAALRTLVPTSHVYPALRADSSLPVDSWLRGYRDGTILVWRNSARQIVKTGVIARGSLRMFASPQAFNTLGFNASNGLSPSGLAMPRVSGQRYRTGVAIDRYALAEVLIKVTNKAGATVTAEVPNANGLYGLGTLDPAPAGWDKTR